MNELMQKECFILHNQKQLVEDLLWDEDEIGSDLTGYAREILDRLWDAFKEEARA